MRIQSKGDSKHDEGEAKEEKKQINSQIYGLNSHLFVFRHFTSQEKITKEAKMNRMVEEMHKYNGFLKRVHLKYTQCTLVADLNWIFSVENALASPKHLLYNRIKLRTVGRKSPKFT